MWKKKGLLFKTEDFLSDSLTSHASIPFVYHLEGNRFRIFFSSRNAHGKSLPYFIDSVIENGTIALTGNVVGPVMSLGNLGTFDDSGIMPSCLIKNGNQLWMYYIGWNPQITVSYRLSIGLAISEDNGRTFKRFSDAPICDRSLEEPYFNTAPYVLFDDQKWKMWYISCTGWSIINDYPEPSYHIKYAESEDGIHWKRNGVVCLDYDDKAKALGRPCVIKTDGYEMYFSYRDTNQYRELAGNGYQIGRAISKDGVNWEKLYAQTGIELSDSGWDAKMMEYCHVFEYQGIEYMVYNGNDFGKQGFGYATR